MSPAATVSTQAKAGALALLVHGAFFLLLVFGTSWQTEHPAPVMVDLWQALPEPPTPQPKESLRPPQAEPEPEPKPVVKEKPALPDPEIALEKKKHEAKLKQALVDEQKALAKTARDETEKLKKQREIQTNLEEQALQRRMMDEALASESRQVKQMTKQATASRRTSAMAGIVSEYQARIRDKIHGQTRLPENLQGNPQVRHSVKLLPTGEVLSVKTLQRSGNPAYDDAVERAIYKSSPLPLPDDKEARAVFVPEMVLTSRPRE